MTPDNRGDVIHVDSNLPVPEKATLTTIRITPTDSLCGSAASSPASERTANNPFDTDIEALPSHSTVEKPCRKSMAIEQSECKVWPGKDHWKRQAQEAKMKRSCSCLARLSRRNRIICKVVLILLVVGIAVSVGFGVSKPLGAPIWGKKPEEP